MRVRHCLSYVYHDKHFDRSLQEKQIILTSIKGYYLQLCLTWYDL